MVRDMFARFDPDWRDDTAAMAAYDRHNVAVRREVPPDRLVEWQPGGDWEPLCTALGIAVPAEPFRTSTRPMSSRPDGTRAQGTTAPTNDVCG